MNENSFELYGSSQPMPPWSAPQTVGHRSTWSAGQASFPGDLAATKVSRCSAVLRRPSDFIGLPIVDVLPTDDDAPDLGNVGRHVLELPGLLCQRAPPRGRPTRPRI